MRDALAARRRCTFPVSSHWTRARIVAKHFVADTVHDRTRCPASD
jgi:hypothetical protein